MLCLQRKKNESLRFVLPDGTEFQVFVLNLGPQKVVLGTDAPREIQVHRSEIQVETTETKP